MGPKSKGHQFLLSRKLCFLSPLIIVLFSLALFPWYISCHNNDAKQEGEEKSARPEHRAGLLNGTISSESDYMVTGEILRKALINHTLSHPEQDLDKLNLDHLIFSSLPQGSKLVLQSVKVVQTDENGEPLPSSSKSTPVHWDVKITNATSDHEDENSDDTEEEEEEEEEENENNNKKNVDKIVLPSEGKGEVDLVHSGSHAQANYKVYGNQERTKEKSQKSHHGNDYGKKNTITHTDTDGKEVKKYKGKEDGVKDYANEKGTKQSNEHERYKDTKKKNKGRRVSGFKRVYHKEEFQRTEHFYDDEDAKRIAESYGMKDAKENSNHGLKDDDRKYHGTRTEYTDGKEIKDEKQKSHGFNKGQQNEYKDSEKNNQHSHYSKSNSHGSAPSYNGKQQQQQQYHHPSHNYHGSYSAPKSTSVLSTSSLWPPYTSNPFFMNFKPGYIQSSFTPMTHNNDANINKAPMLASFVITDIHKDSSTAASSPDQLFRAKPNTNNLKLNGDKPDEVKIYHSPRDRKVEPEAGDFFNGQAEVWSFRNKIGNLSQEANNKSSSPKRKNGKERDARKYSGSSVKNTFLDPEINEGDYNNNNGGFSTLHKIPVVNYINLGEGEEAEEDENEDDDDDNGQRNNETSQTASHHQESLKPEVISITTPPKYRRPLPPPRSHPPNRWVALSFGHEMVNEVKANNNNNNPYNRQPPPHYISRPLTISNIMRGVVRPIYRFHPRHPPMSQPQPPRNPLVVNHYDTSKYPPNVVVGKNGNKKNQSENSELNGENDHNRIIISNNNNHPRKKPHQPQYNLHNSEANNKLVKRPMHINNRPPPQKAIIPLPPFMNTLMNSVADFFSNVG